MELVSSTCQTQQDPSAGQKYNTVHQLALNREALVENGAWTWSLFRVGFDPKPERLNDGDGNETKPDGEHACGTASGHKGWNLRHHRDVHKLIHVTS